MSSLASSLYEENGVLKLYKKENHPLLLSYSEIYKEALLRVRLIDGRLNPKGSILNHPIVKGLKNLDKVPEDKWFNYLKKTIKDYYKSFSPKNIKEWFQLDLYNEKFLAKPYHSVLPWRARSIESFGKVMEDNIIKESLAAGSKEGLQFGWTYAGPVSNKKVDFEVDRYLKIYKSIKDDGYNRTNDKDGDIIVTALIEDNGEWVWFPTSGIHRSHVLAALGYKDFIARLNLVIQKANASYFPNVVSNLYSKEEAVKVFNQIYKG